MPILLSVAAMTMAALSAPEEAAAFKAAGFTRTQRGWSACGDPGSAGYHAGFVQAVHDLNRDGPPEAILTEESSACFGKAGAGYWIVSKQANGSWRLITKGTGVVRVLDTRGAGNWPDLEIGGPGTCFPVQRWNGRAYVLNRRAYGGRPCR